MREGRDVGQAEANEIGEMQRTRTRDMAERVAANVAVIGSVGKRADADAVEDDPDDARKWRFGRNDARSPARNVADDSRAMMRKMQTPRRCPSQSEAQAAPRNDSKNGFYRLPALRSIPPSMKWVLPVT